MADNTQTSTSPRELKTIASPAKQRVQLSGAELNWYRMNEGIGQEALDNEFIQSEMLQQEVPPTPIFGGSISFAEPNLNQVTVSAAQETVVKVAEKTAEVVATNAKDVMDAGADLLKYITGPENISYTTASNTTQSINVENNQKTSSAAVDNEIRIKQIHSFIETTDTAQHLARREETTKMALRIIEKPNLTEEDATLLKVNVNSIEHMQHLNAITSLAAKYTEVRNIQMGQAKAQSFQETSGGDRAGLIRQDNIAEGGNAQLSVTGGGAPG